MLKQTLSRQSDYSDLDLDFLKNPTTNDVVMKRGDDAIKRSIRNLILTNYYDRPFRPTIGSNVQKLLFDEIADPFIKNLLENAISETIFKFEPRVRLDSVIVDADLDANGINVRLQYTILNREQPVVTTIFLERIR
jgi:phage baseplate assembly protein W